MTTMHRNALPTNRSTDRPTLPRPLLWLLVLAIWQVLALPATARAGEPTYTRSASVCRVTSAPAPMTLSAAMRTLSLSVALTPIKLPCPISQ